MENVPVHIMPAGALGAVAYYAIKNTCRLDGFLDNIKGTVQDADFCRLPVISPKDANINATVIIASFRYERKFIKELKALGFSNIVNVRNFMTPENASIAVEYIKKNNIDQEYKLLWLEEEVRQFFLDYGNEDLLIVTKAEFVVTQRCSLKCRDCSALMQYYSNPVNLDIDTVIKSVDSFFSYVDYSRTVNIIGGEPLMVKDLARLINKISEYRMRISELTIITNGTIIPGDEVILAMVKAGVTIIISDYKELSRKKTDLIATLTSGGVKHKVVEHLQWTKMQSFSASTRPPCSVFKSCDAYCMQIMNGKLFYCNFAAHGEALSGFPYNVANSIDLFNENTTKETIRAYVERQSGIPACAYCTGNDLSMENIPVAMQVDSPLPYVRYDDSKFVCKGKTNG